MKDLTSKVWLKVLIFILTVASIVMTVASVIGIYCAVATEVYTTPKEDYKYNSARHTAYSYTLNILNEHFFRANESRTQLQNISFCEIKDFDSGETLILHGDRENGGMLYTFRASAATYYTANGEYIDSGIFFCDNFGAKTKYETRVTVELMLSDTPSAEDRYYMTLKGVDLIYQLRYCIFPVALFFVICSVLGFVFLMYASGRKKGTSEIKPGFGTKIPIDLFLAAVIGIFTFALFILDQNGMNEPQDMVLVAVYVVAAVSAVLGLAMSIAARIKLGSLFKNTVIYMTLSLISKCIRCVFRLFKRLAKKLTSITSDVNITAKAVIIFIAVCITDLILSSLIGAKGGFIVIWLLFKLVCLGVVIVSAFMFMKLHKGAKKLSDGKLEEKIDTSALLFSDFKKHGEYLNNIAQGMETALRSRLKSERMKTELITNVSHDIKTPLTSIINYSDLISKEHTENEKITEYSTVLVRQSEKLKRLIEDLVEASKASTGNLDVKLEPLQADVFIHQAVAEYRDRLEKSSLSVIISIPDAPVTVMADGRRLWRVFDNLMNNICKYSLAGTRVYISLVKEGDKAEITFKNTSRDELNISADELLERFTRGDRSRNTEGNGLGLSIAQSLTELQGGKMNLTTDGDLFKVRLKFTCV